METLLDPRPATNPAAPAPPEPGGPDALASLATLARVVWRRHRQERSGRWSRAQLQAHQAQALAGLRRFVAERSPFYRRFHAGLEGAPLAQLPVLDKATLMANFDELVTDRALTLAGVEQHLAQAAQAGAGGVDGLHLGRYVVLATSGSTGRRGVFVFDRDEWLGALAAIARPVAWTGVAQPRGRPRAALVASGAPWHYSARVGRALQSPLLPTLRLDAGQPLDEMVRALNDWRPTLLGGYPSVLLQLAAERAAGRLKIQPAIVTSSAEPLPEETRRRVQQAFGVRMFNTYGATEYSPIASECAQGQLHLLEDRAIVEVVDERGRAVPPGEEGQRLLLTVLDRRTQPLIRYEISDMVREQPGVCPCGRPFRMLQQVQGRVEDALHFAAQSGAGESVTLRPVQVHAVLERIPASGWQLLQGEDGSLELLLLGEVDAATAPAAQAACEALQAVLRTQGAVVPTIAVTPVAALRRGATGKAPLIAAWRPGGPGLSRP